MERRLRLREEREIVRPHRGRLEWRVIVQFVVDTQGRAVDPKVIRGLGAGLDEEALRVIGLARFKPGLQRGRAVPVRMALPITFRLSQAASPQNDGPAWAESFVVTGGLSAETVRMVLDRHQADVDQCLRQARADGLRGPNILRMTILPEGRLDTLTLSQTEAAWARLAQCFDEHARQWRFPAAPVKRSTLVSLTFVLGAAEE